MYIGVPAVLGFTGAAIAQQTGYDINVIEGTRQAIAASIPTAIIIGGSSKQDDEETKEKLKKAKKWFADHSYATPLIGGVVMAGLYFIGGLGMEYLTEMEISQPFTAAVGGIEGIILGMIGSTASKSEK